MWMGEQDVSALARAYLFLTSEGREKWRTPQKECLFPGSLLAVRCNVRLFRGFRREA